MQTQQLHPFLKQAVGGFIGIIVAYGIYIAVQEITALRASVVSPSQGEAQQELLFPEPISRGERIAERARRTLAEETPSRRLPPAILPAPPCCDDSGTHTGCCGTTNN